MGIKWIAYKGRQAGVMGLSTALGGVCREGLGLNASPVGDFYSHRTKHRPLAVNNTTS